MRVLKSYKTCEGQTEIWEHDARATGTAMKLATFVPKGGARGCLIWLSGLTCNEENFITKAGAQRYLADHGLMVLCPDTSPRGLDLPGEHASWDFGSGAGFYVDAITPGYREHYRMYDYVADELHDLVQERFHVAADRISLMGHSMGGHGALVIGLRESHKFRSLSAFSPIVNPTKCPWGQKAFAGYLGERPDLWASYDACELVRSGRRHPSRILLDQGTADTFLATELLTEHFVDACHAAGQPLEARFREGYDHSYYFISTFIGEHVAFHARALM